MVLGKDTKGTDLRPMVEGVKSTGLCGQLGSDEREERVEDGFHVGGQLCQAPKSSAASVVSGSGESNQFSLGHAGFQVLLDN